MIKLMVDEGYAFDFLSILEIKMKKNCNDIRHKINFERCVKELIQEIGKDLFFRIIESTEYKNLLNSNIKTYDAVEMAKTDDVSASYVDSCNFERYVCKRRLMDVYFKDDVMTEIKIGEYFDEKS